MYIYIYIYIYYIYYIIYVFYLLYLASEIINIFYFHSFRPTNNTDCYRYADKTVMFVFCKYTYINLYICIYVYIYIYIYIYI